MAAVKQTIGAKHPDVLMELHDFQKQIRDGLVMERVMATLSGFFGLLAAVLAAIEIYGVLSYVIVMRRNEIGVRMALGASQASVLSLVLRQTALLLAEGVAIGVALALATAHGAGSLLFGLRANDPMTFVTASALLVATALLACYLPVRRAMQIDPMVALRYE
jgi:ABC-type antimicrobial peptide transport system permease subunit